VLGAASCLQPQAHILLSDQYVRRLDDRRDAVAAGEPQVFHRLAGEGDDGSAADIDLHLRGNRPFLHRDDRPFS